MGGAQRGPDSWYAAKHELLDAAIASIQEAGEIRDGVSLTRLLVDLARRGCVIVEPQLGGAVIPDDYVAVVTPIPTEPFHREKRWDSKAHEWVEVNVSAHWEEFSARGGSVQPTDLLCNLIAGAAGCTHPVSMAAPIPDGEKNGVAWHHEVERTDLSGRIQRQGGDRYERRSEHATSLAQSRARKRAIRALLAIGTHYGHEVLGCPVIVCRLEYRHVKGDVEFDRLARKARLAAAHGFQQAIYAPPVLDAPPGAATIDAPQQEQGPSQEADLRQRMTAAVDQARAEGLDDDAIARCAHRAGLVRQSPTPETIDAFERALLQEQQTPRQPQDPPQQQASQQQSQPRQQTPQQSQQQQGVPRTTGRGDLPF